LEILVDIRLQVNKMSGQQPLLSTSRGRKFSVSGRKRRKRKHRR
jgi:hypothetical protein